MKEPQLFELETWEAIIRDDGWKLYVGILEDHKKSLERQALICIAKQDFHNAVRYEAKAEDTTKLLSLVKERITFLRTGGKDGRPDER